jgi:hypothetical protein
MTKRGNFHLRIKDPLTSLQTITTPVPDIHVSIMSMTPVHYHRCDDCAKTFQTLGRLKSVSENSVLGLN